MAENIEDIDRRIKKLLERQLRAASMCNYLLLAAVVAMILGLILFAIIIFEN